MTLLSETDGYKCSVWAMPSARATHAPHRANLRCLGLSVGIAIAAAATSGCGMQTDFDAKRPLECLFIPTGEIFRQSSPIFLSAGNWTVSVKRGEWTQQITNETADKWRCRSAAGPKDNAQDIGGPSQ